ncbi:putative toxin-antitoxin system toxin component, PIN family [Thermococcus argininiproducens]|uniref:Toxin-antitoxin system toxin component, PIN family n=1 Tax=Thermococcus argininiproducens TaxID=2866384 RepID=A0A9E7SCH7_9EURY|nr:putative toxin-antitoxin system toxin component, PIN family [Thermococcus argininiproducens]USH00009.1 putative toxin-antitoxin system toxin component, PIN family [Thermococcus argininiproducens]
MERNRKKAQKTRFRVVIDTSVLIAGAISTRGYAFDLLKLLVEGNVVNYASLKTLREYKAKIQSKKVLKHLSMDEAMRYLEIMLTFSKRIPVKKSFQRSKRIKELVKDENDIPFLDVVYNAKAGFLITYDRKHLLKIRDKTRKFRLNSHEFYILTPKEFIEEFL